MKQPDPWTADALCAQTDPELFFPSKGGNWISPKRVCGKCPVRTECLEEALADPDLTGVWGGTSYIERDRMRQKARGLAA